MHPAKDDLDFLPEAFYQAGGLKRRFQERSGQADAGDIRRKFAESLL